MPEVDRYSFYTNDLKGRSPEDQLINMLVLVQSERSWEDYDKTVDKSIRGECIMFTYKGELHD